MFEYTQDYTSKKHPHLTENLLKSTRINHHIQNLQGANEIYLLQELDYMKKQLRDLEDLH